MYSIVRSCYKVTGDAFQDSVLGPLLCNVVYDRLLRLKNQSRVKLVAYADDVAVVIVAKHLDEIRLMFDVTFEKIDRWMNTDNLQRANQKTEAVFITRKNHRDHKAKSR